MSKTKIQSTVDGVVIGVVTAVSEAGEPMVAYSGNASELPVAAKSTVAINSDAVGREVALLFECGDLAKPIIMGIIRNEELEAVEERETEQESKVDSGVAIWHPTDQQDELTVDGERVQIRAKKEMVFKCGKSSITLTRAGKVIIRGAYISTRSSGANRIKGGSVQIN